MNFHFFLPQSSNIYLRGEQYGDREYNTVNIVLLLTKLQKFCTLTITTDMLLPARIKLRISSKQKTTYIKRFSQIDCLTCYNECGGWRTYESGIVACVAYLPGGLLAWVVLVTE